MEPVEPPKLKRRSIEEVEEVTGVSQSAATVSAVEPMDDREFLKLRRNARLAIAGFLVLVIGVMLVCLASVPRRAAIVFDYAKLPLVGAAVLCISIVWKTKTLRYQQHAKAYALKKFQESKGCG